MAPQIRSDERVAAEAFAHPPSSSARHAKAQGKRRRRREEAKRSSPSRRSRSHPDDWISAESKPSESTVNVAHARTLPTHNCAVQTRRSASFCQFAALSPLRVHTRARITVYM